MSNDDSRRKAREIADRLQAEKLAAGGEFTAWFEDLYANAAGNADLVPWADEKPHPGLVEWIERGSPGKGGRAIDVGCGIGDNAAYLAERGFAVTAIDLSPSAIDWARRRFSGRRIDFRAADLFQLPPELVGAFDFVHETYTLQALPAEIRPLAMDAVASLLAPGGQMLVICRARAEDQEPLGPPWPLAASELDRFASCGLERISLERFDEHKPDGRIIPHLRVLFGNP